MKVEILQENFDPWQKLSDYQAQMPARAGFGALTVFVGFMRDFNQGDKIESMQLEHYPEMTGSFLEEMVQTAIAKHNLGDVLLIHRTACIKPADPIVLLAVWSAHRHAAYLANREMMEELKSRAPFWKKEKLADGERWVEGNTS